MPEVRLIDANALKDKISNIKLRVKNPEMMAGLVEMKAAALREIKNAPTIEPEVRHGRWIAVSSFDAFGGDEEAWMAHGNPIALHYCSECKNEAYGNEEGKEILSDYCPFCGADMRKEGADNG